MSMRLTDSTHRRWLIAWLRWQSTAWLLGNRPSAAERCLSELLLHRPLDARALASRAHLRARRGELDGAIADARTLTQAHRSRGAADWFNLAFLLETRGDVGEAELGFRRSIALDPELDRAWYGLGLILLQQHRFDEAEAALTRNTRLQPMSPHGWYRLAQVHMSRNESHKAIDIIRRLEGFEPAVAAQLARETGLTAAPC